VGREGIEVEIEPVTGKEWKTARGQALSKQVNEDMRHVLRAGAELKHRQNLGEGINGQPEPQDLLRAAQPGAEFIQLQMREPEVAEGALVQGLSVLPSAGQPGDDGCLTVAEDPFGSRRVQPFGQCRQDHGDLLRGSFQMIQGRVAPGSERCMAGLTAKRLNPFAMAVLAIAKKSRGRGHR
jgi:hypothetical protein